MLLDILVFLLTISYCRGIYFCVLYRYIILLFALYHAHIVYIYVLWCRMMNKLLHKHDRSNHWSRAVVHLEQLHARLFLHCFLSPDVS